MKVSNHRKIKKLKSNFFFKKMKFVFWFDWFSNFFWFNYSNDFFHISQPKRQLDIFNFICRDEEGIDCYSLGPQIKVGDKKVITIQAGQTTLTRTRYVTNKKSTIQMKIRIHVQEENRTAQHGKITWEWTIHISVRKRKG